MHYEVYIDVLFLTNFMMDALLLFTVRKLLKCHANRMRVFIGSAVGAGLTCLFTILPIPKIIKLFLGFVIVSVAMVKIGLAVKGWKCLGKAIAFLYVSAFLFGGMLQIFHSYFCLNGTFYILAAALYLILSGCWNLLLRTHHKQRRECEVLISFGGKEWKIRALIDTGNRLTDPVSGEPVHVIDADIAEKIGFRNAMEIRKEDKGNTLYLRYIPYRTVGGTGVMPVFRVEKICVKAETEHWISKPVLGICGEMLSENENYQMILNADIL